MPVEGSADRVRVSDSERKGEGESKEGGEEGKPDVCVVLCERKGSDGVRASERACLGYHIPSRNMILLPGNIASAADSFLLLPPL